MLLAILALASLGDIATTHIALKRGGFREVNGFARWLYGLVGFWPAAIGIKVVGIGICVLLQSVIVTGVLAAFQVLVVAWNIKELRK